MSRSEATSVVRVAGDDDASSWNEFVDTCPNATFFHRFGWRRIFERYLGHACTYLLHERDGRVTGVLPLCRVRSWIFGDVLVSLPFLVYGGVAASEVEAQQALIERASQLAKSLEVDHLELRHRDGPLAGWPCKQSHVSFRKAISADPDANLAAVPRKQRAMIRKGIAAGLQSERCQDTDRLHRVLLECKRNLGTPFFSRRFLRAIASEFPAETEITLVTHGGDDVAGVMSFRFRDEVLPYYGGGGSAARSLYANDYLYWEVMRRACTDGVRLFDYGRSQIGSGPYRFKKHWGFEPQPLFYECLAVSKPVAELSPTNSRYAGAVELWKKLPLPIAGAVGPQLARLLY